MTLKIKIWDVKHGSAAYIQTPNGTNIVQDLGVGEWKSDDEVFSPLKNLKENWGVGQLDLVIITHPNKDHIDDIMNFDDFSPGQLLRSKHLSKQDILRNVKSDDKYLFDKYFEIDERYTGPVTDEESTANPKNNGGVTIDRFTPFKCSTAETINDRSIVTVFSYATSKVIIPGDNGPCSWKELLNQKEFSAAIDGADILVAPHHGRESGYYAELFDYFKPRLVIVSDGPEKETSAVSAYSQQSSGWTVYHRRDGSKEPRKTVTTRKDGVIEVTIGYDSNTKPYLNVKID